MPTKNTLAASVFAVIAALNLTAGTGCAAVAESPADTNGPRGEARDGDTTELGEANAALRISTTLNADGDACVYKANPDGTIIPGTVKGLECCSTTTPTDCIIILKPFPSGLSYRF